MKKDNRRAYFPILIDLRRYPCLVVGGGRVALRKVMSLLEFNAKVTVVAPRICKELARLSAGGRIDVIRTPYSRKHISGHKIVFSATDNREINEAVSRDCRNEGILMNVADAPDLCDFIMPATLKRGDLVVSVSSQGRAPFYTKHTKRKLEKVLTPSEAEITELAGYFRNRLLSKENSDISRRTKDIAIRKFLSTDWVSIIAAGGSKKAHEFADRLLKEVNKQKDL